MNTTNENYLWSRLLRSGDERRGNIGTSPREAIQDMVDTGMIQSHKQALRTLEKWDDKGWYEYGVSLDLGWKTVDIRPCCNPQCSVSTGVHEGLTFGSGKLDTYGYWSEPCRACAVEHDAEMAAGRRDELINQQVAHYQAQGMTAQASLEMVQQHHEWIYLPAWPSA